MTRSKLFLTIIRNEGIWKTCVKYTHKLPILSICVIFLWGESGLCRYTLI
ncbi:hypothetical protein BR10RB9215_C20380 [Brucella sp. 10RB9215]|nr:hypothetical protein BCH_01048 [Brucella sp. 191011898]SBW15717.1 hypothetical protein BR10RB9215_C20380 [Brucella sp. 10RB9215]